MRVYLFFFFSRGNRVEPVVLESYERTHLKEMKSSSPLFK